MDGKSRRQSKTADKLNNDNGIFLYKKIKTETKNSSMDRYQSIMNQLSQELQNKYCTQEEFDILQERLRFHAQHNTHQWKALLHKINAAATDLYLPLGKLTQILKNPIQIIGPEKDFVERKTITGRKKGLITYAVSNDAAKQTATSSGSEFEKDNAKKDERGTHGNTIDNEPLKQAHNEYNSSVTYDQKQENKKDTLKAGDNQNKEVVYYLPYPDKSGFFWNAKVSPKMENSSAYTLRLPNQNSLSGFYTLLIENDKIITYAIGNESGFIEPVCDIVEKTGNRNIVIVEEGILKKQNDKWYPERNKKLKIKII